MLKLKKTICKLATVGLLLINLSPIASAADFSDVPITHQNYEAISYLQENKIVNGYADGTFQPQQLVNRAEFLKLVIEGSNIPTDIADSTPFNDINEQDWYGKYVRKAYKEGWINGYQDGSFRPTQTINKVEALKILGEAQNWSLPGTILAAPFGDIELGSWYIPYVSYAKSQGFLEENGIIFSPVQLMTRAKISEVIYRTIVTEDPTPESPVAEEPVVEEETIDEDFVPISEGSISTSFFKNITLDQNIPNTFYKNEVYMISGSLSGDQSSVTLILNDTETSKQTTYNTKVENNRFSLPVYLNKSGNFNLGLIPGESGSSNATKISVLSELPANSDEESTPTKPDKLSINFEDGKTEVSYEASANTINKVTFTQNNKEKSYISRQGLNQISVNYADFANFSEGSVSYKVQSASIETESPLKITSDFSDSVNKSFTATTHHYSIKTDEITTNNLPEKVSNNQSIQFSGNLLTNAEIEAIIIKPNGFTDSINLSTTSQTGTYLSNEIIKSGGNFTFNYPTNTQNSTYIVEINDQNGEALVNHPVYVGSIIPLIPDYFDSHPRELFTGSLNLVGKRNQLLNLINNERENHGLSTITLSNDISQLLAQPHADDMAENDYFGHVNPQNQTPSDRRVEAGIPTAVGENIAKDVEIEFAHYGLMRSGAHRKNILNPEWTRVGIGIAIDNGYLVVVEEFSTDQITTSDLEENKNELLTAINNKRSDSGVPALTYSINVEAASKYLNDKAIDDGEALSQELFSQALSNSAVSGASEAFVRVFNLWDQILDSIINDENSLMNANWNKIGIDLQLDSAGNIHTTLIINQS